MVPQYDGDHFSVLYKPNKHHAPNTREEIAELSDLERVNWLSCRFPQRLTSFLRLFEPRALKDQELDAERAKRRPILRAMAKTNCLNLYVDTPNKDLVLPIVRNPVDFGISLRMIRVEAFEEMLNSSKDSSCISDSDTSNS